MIRNMDVLYSFEFIYPVQNFSHTNILLLTNQPKSVPWSKEKERKEKRRRRKIIKERKRKAFNDAELNELDNDLRLVKKLKKGKVSIVCVHNILLLSTFLLISLACVLYEVICLQLCMLSRIVFHRKT